MDSLFHGEVAKQFVGRAEIDEVVYNALTHDKNVTPPASSHRFPYHAVQRQMSVVFYKDPEAVCLPTDHNSYDCVMNKWL